MKGMQEMRECRAIAMLEIKRAGIVKQEEQRFFNDQCFRDSLEAIRKFVVARRRKDGKEARKKWDFILADAVRTEVGCQ